jgi:beta-lactamase superfamily II metal-dependent hydrolase
MVSSPFDTFIGEDTVPLFQEATGSKKAGYLLWGDGVRRLGEQANGRVKVRARGKDGWVKSGALDGESLLEVYFIDVGQGDGILIKTPDFRHIMIDGGHPRGQQNTGKSAADFVDWKFCADYGLEGISLDAMIASHNDFDHYGGLADLLDAEQEDELDATSVAIEAFYHAGVSWWVGPDGKRTLGPTTQSGPRSYLSQLLGDRASAVAATSGAGPQLQGEWKSFIAKVVASRTATGGPTAVGRVGTSTGHLPGFAAAAGKASVRVLGPVEHDIRGQKMLGVLSSDSKSTNGNSVLLRLDYGRSRILLTGDLNRESQDALLEFHAGNVLEFQSDVAKSCHHGSEDVSFRFLQAMNPAATVISSGDGEGHDHPRPRIMAASGATGHLTIQDDQILTPLVYATELARSVSLGHPMAATVHAEQGSNTGDIELGPAALQRVELTYRETKPGDLSPRTRKRRLSGMKVVAGLIYGLVNVRTDGRTILTATMNEGDGSFAVKKFPSRF